MSVFARAYSELSQLSLSTVVILLGVTLTAILFGRLIVWLIRIWGRGKSTVQIEATRSHASVADNELALLKEVRESLGISEGQAVIVRWRLEGHKPLEMKLKTTDRYRKQGVFETPHTIALSDTIFAKFVEHFGQAETSIDTSIKSGWWPGDHPESSVRLGFWITIYVTVITTIISLLIEVLVP